MKECKDMKAFYDAECWAQNKSDKEINSEIVRCEDLKHNYQWNEVGNREYDFRRAEKLRTILNERNST